MGSLRLSYCDINSHMSRSRIRTDAALEHRVLEKLYLLCEF
jgi:hypothetical protein